MIVGGPSLAEVLDAVGFKRRSCWRHPVRNRRIHRLAGAFARGVRWRLSSILTDVGTVLDSMAIAGVAVVDEHSLQISGPLSGWPMIAAAHASTAGLPAAMKVALARSIREGATPQDHPIATLAGLGTIDPRRIDVVIRGDEILDDTDRREYRWRA
jgi:hypothetical protein